MRRVLFGRHTRLLLAAVAGLALSACSNGSSAGSAATQSSGAAAKSAPAKGASASSIDACHLLTSDEIQKEVGGTVDGGKLQTTDSQATCDWTGKRTAGGEYGLTVSVQDFDQDMWNTWASAGRAKAVSGVGEMAFAHVPTSPALMIKQGKYEIDVGVVDLGMSDDRAMDATKALAALVLPRLP